MGCVAMLSPAKLLLDAGGADGACNRAYYAMDDAASAALLASGAQDWQFKSRLPANIVQNGRGAIPRAWALVRSGSGPARTRSGHGNGSHRVDLRPMAPSLPMLPWWRWRADRVKAPMRSRHGYKDVRARHTGLLRWPVRPRVQGGPIAFELHFVQEAQRAGGDIDTHLARAFGSASNGPDRREPRPDRAHPASDESVLRRRPHVARRPIGCSWRDCEYPCLRASADVEGS